ncbi:MAG: Clp protease N-terminal domain-containing protein [Terriglobales bacterium]
MFERYSEAARRVIFYSRYMANQSGSPEIETEHLLLGLLRADMVLARRFLGSPWAAEEIWREVERRKPVRAITPGDLPLSTAAKRALELAADEADRPSSRKILTAHLLLGLLRDKKCLAGLLLHEHGLRLSATREELCQHPYDDSATEKFVRDPRPLPQDVVEVHTRIRSIVSRMEEAIANHDFPKAHSCSDEECIERDKLRLLYQEHGLSGGWIFD